MIHKLQLHPEALLNRHSDRKAALVASISVLQPGRA
jgi:hypothetical protein